MTLRLPELGEHMRQTPAWSLGVDIRLPTPGNFGIPGIPMPAPKVGPTPIFGFDLIRPSEAASTGPATITSIVKDALASSQSQSGSSMVSGSAIELLQLVDGSAKTKQRLDTIATVVAAAVDGRALAEKVETAMAAGQSRKEAVACQTIKAITEGILGSAFTGAISAGIPTYLVAAQIDPRIQATLPLILPLLPYAYKGAEQTAQVMGNVAEGMCHAHFQNP